MFENDIVNEKITEALNIIDEKMTDNKKISSQALIDILTDEVGIKESVEMDSKYARQNLYIISEQLKSIIKEQLLNGVINLTARELEVLNGLIRNLADISDNIMTLHEKKIDIEKKIKENSGHYFDGNDVINDNVHSENDELDVQDIIG